MRIYVRFVERYGGQSGAKHGFMNEFGVGERSYKNTYGFFISRQMAAFTALAPISICCVQVLPITYHKESLTLFTPLH